MKIKLYFDYGCNFVWICDEKSFDVFQPVKISSEGCFIQDYYLYDIENGKAVGKPNKNAWRYPEERLLGQTELEEKADYVDARYLELWVDNEREFSKKDFDSEEDEKRFVSAVRFVYEKLCELFGEDCEIINETGFELTDKERGE